MARCCANALALAQTLEAHPKVSRVSYPGLGSHPQHERAGRLFGGRYGALLAVELVDGIDVFDFLNRLNVFVLDPPLCDTRTLFLPVAPTIYYEMGAERRPLMGIADSLPMGRARGRE